MPPSYPNPYFFYRIHSDKRIHGNTYECEVFYVENSTEIEQNKFEE